MSPLSSVNSGFILRRKFGERYMLDNLQLSAILDTLVLGFKTYGAIKDGCHANVKKFHDMFEEGLIDRLVTEAILGNRDAAENCCDPDSLELVPDLNFEIGLGIDILVEPVVSPDPGEIPLKGVPSASVESLRPQLLPIMYEHIGRLQSFCDGVTASNLGAVLADHNWYALEYTKPSCVFLVAHPKPDAGDITNPHSGYGPEAVIHYRPPCRNYKGSPTQRYPAGIRLLGTIVYGYQALRCFEGPKLLYLPWSKVSAPRSAWGIG
jgi:hypothetical protein